MGTSLGASSELASKPALKCAQCGASLSAVSKGPGPMALVLFTIVGSSRRLFPTKCRLSSKYVQKFTIPDSVAEIDHSAFYGCVSLTSVRIPRSVVQIGQAAFQSCSSLANARIPYSVTRIEPFGFQGCSSLTSVAIPDVQTRIGASAFKGCEGLPFRLRMKRTVFRCVSCGL